MSKINVPIEGFRFFAKLFNSVFALVVVVVAVNVIVVGFLCKCHCFSFVKYPF